MDRDRAELINLRIRVTEQREQLRKLNAEMATLIKRNEELAKIIQEERNGKE